MLVLRNIYISFTFINLLTQLVQVIFDLIGLRIRLNFMCNAFSNEKTTWTFCTISSLSVRVIHTDKWRKGIIELFKKCTLLYLAITSGESTYKFRLKKSFELSMLNAKYSMLKVLRIHFWTYRGFCQWEFKDKILTYILWILYLFNWEYLQMPQLLGFPWYWSTLKFTTCYIYRNPNYLHTWI